MKKLLNKKGFTLMEMLIVVAIIVILVAVAVPTFTGSLNEAKEATDAANLRAAKAVAVNAYMLDDDTLEIEDGWYYHLDTSEFKETAPTTAYSESTSGRVIVVDITNGNVTVDWADLPAAGGNGGV